MGIQVAIGQLDRSPVDAVERILAGLGLGSRVDNARVVIPLSQDGNPVTLSPEQQAVIRREVATAGFARGVSFPTR